MDNIQFLKGVVMTMVCPYLYEILTTGFRLTDKLGIMLLCFLCVHFFGVLKVANS